MFGEESMQSTITIASRYKGPPNSGNGGYSCGLLASGLEGAVEASLRVPPPLDKELTLSVESGEARLLDGDTLVGQAKETILELEVPSLPDPLVLGCEAVDAPGKPNKFVPFGTCFVCGHDREHPDGLCIHAHTVEGHSDLVAARWALSEDFADEDGNVRPEILWSALDCPGYFACAPGEAALLGRLTAETTAPLKACGEAIVLGWDLGGEGRKRRCGTAVFAPDGTLVAKADGLWIIVDPALIAGGK